MPSFYNEHHVFRAAVLSIVLTLVIGPNTAPLCWAWCDPMPAAETGCDHHAAVATSTSVVSDGTCDMVVFSAAGFLREEPRRDLFDQNAQHAILIPCDQLAYGTIAAQPGPNPGFQQSPGQRTPPAVLRL